MIRPKTDVEWTEMDHRVPCLVLHFWNRTRATRRLFILLLRTRHPLLLPLSTLLHTL